MARNYNRRTEKDYGLLRTLFYKVFVVLVVEPVVRLMYKLKVEGRENVPKTSRVIFAGNHVSYLDPPMIAYAVQKCVAYMAKKELFEDKRGVRGKISSCRGRGKASPRGGTFKHPRGGEAGRDTVLHRL